MTRIAIILCALIGTAAHAEAPMNYIEYSDKLASAGQPTQAQIESLAKQGFERIFLIAFDDHDTSLSGEDRLVKNQGMDFLQIPVVWNQPKLSDFQLMAAALQISDAKTLVHCQANYRASAFAFLYRVIYEGIPVAQAKQDMNKIWTPTKTWNDFIFQVLSHHDIDPNCEGCDWTPWEPS